MTQEFRERLIRAGATEQQTDSKIAQIAEDVITQMSTEEKADISNQNIREMIFSLQKACKDIDKNKRSADMSANALQEQIKEGRKTLLDLQEGINTIDATLIKATPETEQAVLLFESVLETVKKTFGESLSDEVMKSAIEAGSYGVWRSIMGEKHNGYKYGKEVR